MSANPRVRNAGTPRGSRLVFLFLLAGLLWTGSPPGRLSACNDIPHYWVTLGEGAGFPLADWLGLDLFGKLATVLGEGKTARGVFHLRGGEPAGWTDAILTTAAQTAGMRWQAGSPDPGKPTDLFRLEIDAVSGRGGWKLLGDPYCLWGPALRFERTQETVVRYLALFPNGSVCGIDEWRMSTALHLDWAWHGFLPAGGLLLRKVEMVLGPHPMEVALWLGQGNPQSPPTAVTIPTRAAGTANLIVPAPSPSPKEISGGQVEREAAEIR